MDGVLDFFLGWKQDTKSHDEENIFHLLDKIERQLDNIEGQLFHNGEIQYENEEDEEEEEDD